MEQAIITTSLPSQQQKQEWKDDPLQMLAKQCDTISGDEDKINKQQMGNKRKYLNGHSNNNNDFGNKNGQNKTKAKSPNKLDHSAISNAAASFMPPPNGFGLSHPMQLAAAFLHPLMPTQRPPPYTPSNNFCPPNTSPFTSPAQLQFMQQLMTAAVQQQLQLPPPPTNIPPNIISQQQLPPNFLPPMFPQQQPQIPSGIPLPANMPMPARKLDQRPPSVNNQFINNNQQNSDAEAAALAAMAMFQQQNGSFPMGQGLTSNGNGTTTMTQQTVDNSLLAQQILQQPIQALLMAAACGQLPSQFACPYRLREGQPCGRLFNSDDQLFAHYKSAHIAQMSSPSAVSSTTEGPASTPSTIQTPTTTAASNSGRPKATKNSPTGIQQTTNNHQSNNKNSVYNGWHQQLFQSPLGGFIPTQPFIGPPPLPPPPPPPTTAATMIGTQNHRFHPYSQQNHGNQQTKSIQMPPPPPSFQQQMALALNLMANSDVSSLQQFAQNNIPPPPPQISSELNSNSQLAALAAMANSLGGNNNQTQIAGSN
ncbi:hypothetical protein ACQ4LE_001421 [Meloidogyne hapla]